MRILVTGASGFVGGNLAKLLSETHQVSAHYHSNKPEEGIADCCSIIRTDLNSQTETKELLQKTKPNCIVHCAAHARTAYCEEHPTEAEKLNITATKLLLNTAATLSPTPLFILCSSDLVYEGEQNKKGGYLETDKPRPISIYAKTKISAEQLLSTYPGSNSIFRLSLVYGPKINGSQGFLSWMRSRLETNQECDLFIDEFRTPVCTLDITAAINEISKLVENKREIPQILNLAGSQRVSRRDFGELLCTHANYPKHLLTTCSQKSLKEGPPRPEDTALNCKELTKLLGRQPLNILQGLKHCEITPAK